MNPVRWLTLVFALIVSSDVGAQVVYQSAASGSAKDANDLDGSLAVPSINPGVAANSIMVAGVVYRQVLGTTDITSVAYAGNNFTAIGSCSNLEQGPTQLVVGFYRLVGQTGTGSVTLTLTAAVGAFVGMAVEVFTGVDQASPIVDSDLSQGASVGVTSTPAVDGTTDGFFVDVLGTRDSAARTPGATQTARHAQTDSGSMSLDMSTAPGASPNDTIDWSFAATQFAHCAASLRAAAGGASTPKTQLLLGVGPAQ